MKICGKVKQEYIIERRFRIDGNNAGAVCSRKPCWRFHEYCYL